VQGSVRSAAKWVSAPNLSAARIGPNCCPHRTYLLSASDQKSFTSGEPRPEVGVSIYMAKLIEENTDPVWKALDASSPRQAPPTLLYGVLRTIRNLEVEKPRPFPFWLPALAPAAAAIAIFAATALQPAVDGPEDTAPIASKSELQLRDFEVISDMDLIHASDENASWLDNSQL